MFGILEFVYVLYVFDLHGLMVILSSVLDNFLCMNCIFFF